MLNERAREFADTYSGGKFQEMLFNKLVEIVKERDNGKYGWVGENFLKSKVLPVFEAYGTHGFSIRSVSGEGRVELSKLDIFFYALLRLEERGLIKIEGHSSGSDVRLMKAGWKEVETVELIEELKKLALEHYEEGGDMMIECWDRTDWNEFLDQTKRKNRTKALLGIMGLWDEKRKGIENTAF